MKYLLVIWVISGGVTTKEMPNRAACEVAASQFNAMAPKNGMGGRLAGASCVPSGE